MAGPGTGQELHPGFPCGLRHSGHLSLTFPGHEQEAGPQADQSGFQRAPTWDAGAAGGGFPQYATTPASISNFST